MVGILKVTDKEIIFQRRGENVIINAFGKDCIRFRSTANSEIINENWNLINQEEVNCTITQDDSKATLVNGKISVDIFNSGKVIYYKNEKEIITELSEFAFSNRFRYYKNSGGNNYKSTVVFESDDKEHFYGLGQDPNDCFDLKGTTSDLHHKNTKTSIPFVYSSKGYGFLWNNPSVGRAELGYNRTLWEANSTKQIDYLVIAGDNPREIMKKYADLTGYAPQFPSWASGFWQCKLRYESQEDLMKVAREYKKRNIPLSVIVIDYFHWTQQGDWRFDPKYWPDPKKMVEELNEMGIKLMISIWPTIHPKSINFAEMDEKNYLIRAENGQYGIFDFYGLVTYIDSTNPETREFMWQKVKENYYDYGIKTFWLDQAEPEIIPNHYDNMKMFLGNGEEVSLLYPHYYSKLFYDGLAKEGEKEILSLARAAWIGTQRYGTLLWSGDIPSTFDSLRKQIKVGLNVSMCGIPWWTTDIGGFYGADITSDYFKELIVRWFQFGVFSPVTRLHGSRLKPEGHVDRHPKILECSGGDNEIWSFGEKAYPILKELVELRERLRPYIHKHMNIASETGTPVMRPMFYDFYEDDVCYSLGDQYMFGDDILFAPIVTQGQINRTVYLPFGVTWINVNDKKEYIGGTYVECNADINEFIAFVRKDSDVLEVF